jgi:hypothetical protein
VTPVNDAPVAITGNIAQVHGHINFSVSSIINDVTDVDGDHLSISAISSPQFGSITFDLQSNSYTYTPDYGFVGVDSLRFEVTDGQGGFATLNYEIRVINELIVGNEIVFVNGTQQVITIQEILRNSYDPDGDQFFISHIDAANFGTLIFDMAVGGYLYSVPAGYVGSDVFNFTIIPTPADQNPCAHSRRPMDMMRHGWSVRRFQWWQQWSTMSS